jgi:hypothetical protein
MTPCAIALEKSLAMDFGLGAVGGNGRAKADGHKCRRCQWAPEAKEHFPAFSPCAAADCGTGEHLPTMLPSARCSKA